MKLHSRLVIVGLLSLGLLSYSCANGDTVSGTTGSGTGNGGDNSTRTGGSNSTSTGGTRTGGSTGTGGVNPGTGGTHTGGSTGTGGIRGTGGITTSGTGGTIVAGTGGTTTTGTGGSTAVACSPTFQPTTGGWVTMPAKSGCWNGYAFSFTETPNCGSTITPADFSTCSTTCALSASGTVGAATAANSYCGVVGIGFNINQAQGATTGSTLAPTGTGITVTFSETAAALPFRVQLRDDSTGTNYCYQATGTSATIPYGSFNTKCYDTPADGVAYAKQPITSVQILIAGGAAATPFTMALMNVQEN